ncbi:hypothetical protein [Novosphingobium sp. FSW06-99]|uniref:hypothetical protein n=1 Tax=Novosphingobium sp. FSW06-99 TaxID=1739113 RepID=UPI00076CDECC|nr:hypothetical protein [Novosphingobium sp. FSW06-99]KUR79005.1 hypothetical protein AQZ49_06205 [Novosphingobium sp. FSW06-99]
MTYPITDKAQLLQSLRACLAYIDKNQCYLVAACLCQCIERAEKLVPDAGRCGSAEPDQGIAP